jgi:hypothetical protein
MHVLPLLNEQWSPRLHAKSFYTGNVVLARKLDGGFARAVYVATLW